MKINLWFEKKQRMLSSNEQDSVIKIFGNIRLLNEDEKWSTPWNAIIDTAAHTSLIPSYIWEKMYHEPLSESLFLGIKSNLLCSVPCKVAKVYAALVDLEGNCTKPFEMNAYLAKSNDVPLIIGVSTALTRFNLNVDYKNEKAYLNE